MSIELVITRLHGVEALGKYSLPMTVFMVGQSCVGRGPTVIVTSEVATRPAEVSRYFTVIVVLGAGIVALVGSLLVLRAGAALGVALCCGGTGCDGRRGRPSGLHRAHAQHSRVWGNPDGERAVNDACDRGVSEPR